MATVNVRQAKTHLSRLLAQVEAGREMVIARNGTPVAQLVPLRERGIRQFGTLRGQFLRATPRDRVGGLGEVARYGVRRLW